MYLLRYILSSGEKQHLKSILETISRRVIHLLVSLLLVVTLDFATANTTQATVSINWWS